MACAIAVSRPGLGHRKRHPNTALKRRAQPLQWAPAMVRHYGQEVRKHRLANEEARGLLRPVGKE
jgi:hypothetical protein